MIDTVMVSLLMTIHAFCLVLSHCLSQAPNESLGTLSSDGENLYEDDQVFDHHDVFSEHSRKTSAFKIDDIKQSPNKAHILQ